MVAMKTWPGIHTKMLQTSSEFRLHTALLALRLTSGTVSVWAVQLPSGCNAAVCLNSLMWLRRLVNVGVCLGVCVGVCRGPCDFISKAQQRRV